MNDYRDERQRLVRLLRHAERAAVASLTPGAREAAGLRAAEFRRRLEVLDSGGTLPRYEPPRAAGQDRRRRRRSRPRTPTRPRVITPSLSTRLVEAYRAMVAAGRPVDRIALAKAVGVNKGYVSDAVNRLRAAGVEAFEALPRTKRLQPPPPPEEIRREAQAIREEHIREMRARAPHPCDTATPRCRVYRAAPPYTRRGFA